jgi:hypothetical protein
VLVNEIAKLSVSLQKGLTCACLQVPRHVGEEHKRGTNLSKELLTRKDRDRD